MKAKNWLFAALYCVIAFAVSVPFNTGKFYEWLHLAGGMPGWADRWLFLPAALGPLLAAVSLYLLDGGIRRSVSLTGNSAARNLLAGVLPTAGFAAAGFIEDGFAGASKMFVMSVVTVVYALGEEAGWRGYLFDALSPLGTFGRSLLTGMVWWAWHIRFSSGFELLVFPAIIIGSSFLLDAAVRGSRSLLVAAGMHGMIIMLTSRGVPTRTEIMAAACVVAGWIMIGRKQRPGPDHN